MGMFDWLSGLFSRASPGRPTAPAAGAASPAPPPEQQPRPRQSGPKRLEGLDASQFAPLEIDDARGQAKRLSRSFGRFVWGNRTDRIPPANDARTLLIDRMMVAEGLVTPEELADIHRVGAEMDRLRPDYNAAHRAGAEAAEQAAASSRQEREQRKAEKKAAAAERKRERAEQIAERRRSDIVFLGRGVSRGLADRQSYPDLLGSFGLPVMATPADVVQAMGFLDIAELRWLAFHTEAATRTHYVQFTTRKKSGGVRVLASPHRKLRRAQGWVLENIISKIRVDDAAHGFVAGRSTVSNATPHVGQQVVVNADLKDFFPSITFYRVEGFFRRLGYSGAVATILALLTTECPRQQVTYAGQTLWVATGPRCLPQGACTSPGLSNAIAWKLDRRLGGMARGLGWTYTRYADDVTFSASGEPAAKVGWLLARLRHLAQEEGFELNHKKTRVQRQNAQQSVTGLVVNDRVGVSRKAVRRLRAILHNAKQTGLEAQNRDNHPNFTGWVQGMIAYVAMANAEQGASLQAAFDEL